MTRDLKFKRIYKAGQVHEGDHIVLHTRNGIITAIAREVLNPGSTEPGNGEEVVYNRSKNHYFITSMLINNESWVKAAYVIHLPD